MKSASLILIVSSALITGSRSDQNAEDERSKTQWMEQEYRDRKGNFDREMQGLMIKLVKGQSGVTTGEQGIIKLMNWFALKSDEIQEINQLAEILDEREPLPKEELRIPMVEGDSPEAEPANIMREAVNLLMAGEIDHEQFEAKRALAIQKIEMLSEARNASRKEAQASMAGSSIPAFESLEEGREIARQKMRALRNASAQELAEIAADPDHPFRVMIYQLMEMDQASRDGDLLK